jgi:magnesium transporter
MRKIKSAHERAVHHIVTRVPVATEDEAVDEVIERLRTEPFETVEAVFVVDGERALQGAVRMQDLLGAPPQHRMRELMDRDYPRSDRHHHQEDVAAEALERRASAVAVVDDRGRLVGAVPALALLDILRHEHVEDLHRLAGIQREAAKSRTALEAPPARRARHRLPWLLIGLAGTMLAATVVSRFEQLLARNMAVAFFVPAIVYLADAIGTQTETIVVRGLSLSRLPIGHLLADELRTGLLIGVTLASLAFPVVALAFGDVRLGVSVSVAIVVAGAVATSIGLLFPWMLQRAGSDPAFGSGPVATIVQDVLSLVIYLGIAALVLGA